MELVLDGSKTRARGRPKVSFYDPRLPMAKRPVAKLAHKCTGIFGSNAAGECAPIHFQLVNQATTEDGRKLQFEFFKHIWYICGKFRRAEAKDFPCTVGMNEKGGMNVLEFKKYIDNIINDMFLDMEDVPGKRVLLNMDSGPGHNCATMLVKAKFKGLYIYPGLSNVTAVHQEMDQSYGPFKLVVCTNLDQIAMACHAAGKTMKLGMSAFGLIVYSGKCPELGVMCQNAVDLTFDRESNLSTCLKVGAVPFTMACLENKKVVAHDGTDKSNPMFDVYQDIQLQNNYAAMQLTMMGYSGNVLKADFCPDKIRQRRTEETVTVELTHGQQVALAAAKTCGKRFFVTGGGQHLNADDGFITAEMCFREATVKEKEKEKKSWMEGNVKRDAR